MDYIREKNSKGNKEVALFVLVISSSSINSTKGHHKNTNIFEIFIYFTNINTTTTGKVKNTMLSSCS